MQFLLDNLTATLVGSVILLILLATSSRVGDSETQTQLYELSRRQSQGLAQQLERDLPNIGYGVPSTTATIAEWTDSTFTFRRRADTTATAAVIDVSYNRVQVGTVTVDGVAVPRYEVQRFEGGARQGGAPGSFWEFDLDLLDQSGAPTTDPALARGVKVHSKSSFADRAADQGTSASRYERTFYPANLAD